MQTDTSHLSSYLPLRLQESHLVSRLPTSCNGREEETRGEKGGTRKRVTQDKVLNAPVTELKGEEL